MSNWERGSSRGWRRVRAAVLARDQYLCQLRIAGVCTVRATCVHHVVGRGTSGDDPRWLKSSCTECNLKLGDPTKRDPQPQPRTKW